MIHPFSRASTLLQGVDPVLLDGALTIAKRLNEHQYEVYFSGGAVRDLLLGREGISEIDLVTSAPPEEVERLFERTIDVGKQFGVVIVVMDSTQYQVSTFRQESGYLNGRHPTEVSFTDSRHDALRRDFTVNALFLNPFNQEILDYVKGREDLDRKLIRTVGPSARRFNEDKLRILRAVRFACQLGFEIDPETYREVQNFAEKLTEVSWERIREEVLKILTGPAPAGGLRLLLDSGLLRIILPEVATMRGVEQPAEFHPEGDVFEHTCLMFDQAERVDETLALGILLHDVGKPPTFSVKERIRFDGHVKMGVEMAERICRRLRLSNQQTEEVKDLIEHHLHFINVKEMRESTLKRFLRKENIDQHLELHRRDCLASHGDLSSYEFCQNKLKELDKEAMRPQPLINGDDLIRQGFKPGPLFSEILTTVEDLQLEGKLTSKEQVLEWVMKKYRMTNTTDN